MSTKQGSPVRPFDPQLLRQTQSAPAGAGWWYRVDAELHDIARATAARDASIPIEEFKNRVVGGWRVLPPGRPVPTLAVSVDEHGTDRWSMWWLARHGAQPSTLDVVRPEADVLAPLGDAWPLHALADAKVAVIGVRSIGSAACDQLVIYGARKLVLIDPDHVRPHNIARMRLGPGHIGRRKVNAVAKHIEQRDASTEIVPLWLDVIEDADFLRPILCEMDAILVCTDGIAPRRVANHLAARAGVPAVFACVLEDGAIGEVLRVLPRRTGCLLCNRAELAAEGGIDPEPSLDQGYGTGSRHRPTTAVGGDLAMIGDLAAKVVVETVLDRAGYREHRLPGDHAIVVLRATPGLAAPFEASHAAAVTWRVVGRPRRLSHVQAGLTPRIVLAREARETISGLAQASADGRETGGILLGRGPDDDGVIEVVEAGDPGPNAERQKDFFLRDLEHARRLAARAWERDRAQWVGEWHTHPCSGPQPSSRDLATYALLLGHAELRFAAFISIIVTPHAVEGCDEPLLVTWVLTDLGRRPDAGTERWPSKPG
jgi:integrative and conjugative element protein (TIGR02256 family)